MTFLRFSYFLFFFELRSRCSAFDGLKKKRSQYRNSSAFDSLKRKRAQYRNGLRYLKKGYMILASLEKELFIDSSEFFAALEFYQHGEYDQAIPLLNNLITQDIYFLESNFILAECYFKKSKGKNGEHYDLKLIEKSMVFYNTVILKYQKNTGNLQYVDFAKSSFLQLMECFILLDLRQDAITMLKTYLFYFPEERSSPDIIAFCSKNNCSYFLKIGNESEDHEGIALVTKKKKCAKS